MRIMVEHLFIISIILFAAGSLFALCFYGWQRLGNYIFTYYCSYCVVFQYCNSCDCSLL